MSLLNDFTRELQVNNRRLFHFTDSRNIDSIREHGLLPTDHIVLRGLNVVTGGDEDSLGIDRHKGLDRFVRLSFCRQHPMSHVARQSGRIQDVRILMVCPSVLLVEGVVLADRVATANDAEIDLPQNMIGRMDLEAIYERIDWKVPGNRARRLAAEKWEALIPVPIATQLIRGL